MLVLFNPSKQKLGCYSTLLACWLPYRRQRRRCVCRQRYVVVTNNRYVIGHTQTGLLDCAQRANRGEVIAREDGSWPLLQLQQPGHSVEAHLFSRVSGHLVARAASADDKPLVDRRPVLIQRFQIALKTFQR